VIRQPFKRIGELTAAGIMPTEVAARLSAFEPSAQGEPIKPVLFHGDLHPRHIYAAEEELTGYGIERTPELDRTLTFYRVT
jgi:aminoglycoside phosphotransferase (APT) family kinase protein